MVVISRQSETGQGPWKYLTSNIKGICIEFYVKNDFCNYNMYICYGPSETFMKWGNQGNWEWTWGVRVQPMVQTTKCPHALTLFTCSALLLLCDLTVQSVCNINREEKPSKYTEMQRIYSADSHLKQEKLNFLFQLFSLWHFPWPWKWMKIKWVKVTKISINRWSRVLCLHKVGAIQRSVW